MEGTGEGEGDNWMQINRVKWRESRCAAWWINMNKARDGRRVCQRRVRQRGWERFLADFGSCSVLLPSSWTSLVAGVNYWDCTHTHADQCVHTGTWTHTHGHTHTHTACDSGSPCEPCLNQQRAGEMVPDRQKNRNVESSHTSVSPLWEFSMLLMVLVAAGRGTSDTVHSVNDWTCVYGLESIIANE